MPSSVFAWNKRTKAEFIAGYLDADGAAVDTKNGYGYQATAVSKQLLLDLQTLLKTFGILSKVAFGTLGGLKEMPGGEYNTKPTWRISISQANSVKLSKIVKFSRLKSFAKRKAVYEIKPRMGKVVSIKALGIEEVVYCCTVPTTHRLQIGVGIMTGQCGEQPLPPNGACLLGSLNLAKYVNGKVRPIQDIAHQFDWELFKKDIDAAVRAFDNVIDSTKYPLREQKIEEQSKRRMGIGVTGMANMLEYLGYSYGTDLYIEAQDSVLAFLRDTAYLSSINLAEVKRPFALWNYEGWNKSGFAQTLPNEIREKAQKTGLRNGLLLSIAPTGTISMCADNVSSGIEPPWSLEHSRDVNMEGSIKEVELSDYAFRKWGVKSKTASEVSAVDHVRVLCAAQHYVDSAVSKTCNVNGALHGVVEEGQVPYSEFKHLYTLAYNGGAKGLTTFNLNGKRNGIIRSKSVGGISEEVASSEGGSCYVDADTGVRTCDA